jgi:Arc/MetJ-type ribon-helix-helix transcriptional regulator
MLEDLKASTGCSESELVRRGLRLLSGNLERRPTARELAGRSVGRFRNGPRDLARNKKHLDGFGR